MKKWFAILVAPFALIACSSGGDGDGGGSGGGSSFSGDLVIDDSNKDAVIRNALGQFSSSGDMLSDPFDGFSGFLFTGDDTSGNSLDPRDISARIQESVNCDSGSASVTANTSDVDQSPIPASGSASFSADYNNCVFSSSGDGFSFSMTIDGSMSASLSWTGYNDGTGDFDSFDMEIDIDNFSFVMNSNGEESSFAMDFSASLSFDDPTATYSYSGSFGIEEAGNGFVDMTTVDPIVMNVDDTYPSSGKVVMNGGDGTSITYTVVANGVEVSVNGGTAQLYTWSEVESM